MKGLTIGVTGASGFLGGHLLHWACKGDNRAVALSRTPASTSSPKLQWRRSDLQSVEQLTEALKGVDVLVANAALAPGWKPKEKALFHQVNVVGLDHTLTAAAAAGVSRVVYVSTVGVYRLSARNNNPDETCRLRRPGERILDLSRLTTNVNYTRSKVDAEALFWQKTSSLGLEAVAVRPGPMVGPNDPKLTARYRRSLTKRYCLAPTAAIPHGFAPDIARATVEACQRPVDGHAFNLTGQSLSILGFLRRWKQLSGSATRLIAVPTPLVVQFNDSKAIKMLDFRASPLSTIVEACVDDL